MFVMNVGAKRLKLVRQEFRGWLCHRGQGRGVSTDESCPWGQTRGRLRGQHNSVVGWRSRIRAASRISHTHKAIQTGRRSRFWMKGL